MEVSNYIIAKIHTRLMLQRLPFVFCEDETYFTVNRGFHVIEKCAQGKI